MLWLIIEEGRALCIDLWNSCDIYFFILINLVDFMTIN